MFRFTEMDELVKEYGKDGTRLLVLFRLLKSKVTLEFQQYYPNLTLNETVLNYLCIARAYELMELRKDDPTEKDIRDLLSRLA